MPEIFRAYGLRFFFYSREHEPIHVHVKNSDGVAKFILTSGGFILDYNKGIKVREISIAQKLLSENKQLVVNIWIEHNGIANASEGDL